MKNLSASCIVILGFAPFSAGADVLAPEFTPDAADVATSFYLTVSSGDESAEIHYTLNGAEPTRFDPVISSGATIAVTRNLTVSARSWVDDVPGPVKTATYRLTGDVAAGGEHAIALAWSGSVWAWGNQNSGRLGNNQTSSANVPWPTSSLYGPSEAILNGAMIAAGSNHSVVLNYSREVLTFGNNASGELGINSTANSAIAVEVLQSTTAGDYLGPCIGVSAGLDFSMALTEGGKVYAWGNRAAGRVGDGGTSGIRKYAVPVQKADSGYPDLDGIASIASGKAFGLAREKTDSEETGSLGRVWVWGHNANGQLGIGSTANKTRAQVVMEDATTELKDCWDIAGGESHAVVVRWNPNNPNLQGAVWAFGAQQHGRLGNNLESSANVTFPVQVMKGPIQNPAPLDGIESIACGSAHTLALSSDGTVWAWGYNGQGAIGDGTAVNRAVAVQVQDPNDPTGILQNIVRIGAGGEGTNNFSMAIAADGSLYTWGKNANGQLGQGTTSSSPTLFPTKAEGLALLPLVPDVTLSLAVSENAAPGVATVTALPTHGSSAGSAFIDRVELFLNGQPAGACLPPNWTATLSMLPEGDYHLYGIAYDYPGNSAMSLPVLFEIGGMVQGGPDDDPDGDGLTNAEEALLGTNPGSTSFTGHSGSESYSYDDLDRLLNVTGARSHSYTLDPAGNIESAQ